MKLKKSGMLKTKTNRKLHLIKRTRDKVLYKKNNQSVFSFNKQTNTPDT